MGALTGRLAIALLGLSVVLRPAVAAAQERIVVLHDPRVDDRAPREVSKALSDFSQMEDERFVRAAEAPHLDPLSDAAFTRGYPTDLVDLVVVLLPARRGLTLVLRSGRDGSVLAEHALRFRRGKLPRKAIRSIPRWVRAELAKLPPKRKEPLVHAADPLEEAPAVTTQPDEVIEDAESFAEETVSDEPADATVDSEPVEEEERRLLGLHVELGTGLSSRHVEFPIEAGTGRVSVGPSAALDVGLLASYNPSSAVSWGLQLRYQTSVGARVSEQPIGGVERPMGIRSARFEALLVPTFELSGFLQLKLAAGYGVRGLRTDVHDQELPSTHSLQTPDYTLSGPVAQVALRLALGDSVALLLAPEAQLLLSVGSDLKRRGVSGGGYAFGGMATLVVQFSARFSGYLAYRQAHAHIAGEDGRASVRDAERYITAGLRGAL